ncbi:T9SS type A sorting domain-containing protein [Winogradskyella schleiferi]|uniref:T9SS type A sorting domain-containing protein n=1 Tax=Winogradskyella schleiferi TaxID=2686078 RepID=UPI0015C10CE4|nr:T9SS type A sorting domain-containing protein [Winogradskyella schleiferi]
MKKLAYILLLFSFGQVLQAQDNSGYRIISSNLGSSGSSQEVVTAKGTYKISQSIGQSSVIGTHTKNGYYLRQGYQQPSVNVKTFEELNYQLEAKVYPNPFVNDIIIEFSTKISKDIAISILDVNGRIIHSQIFLPSQELELQINDVANGTYFLKVVSGEHHFNTKLIKI